jgi:hypothetical protein
MTQRPETLPACANYLMFVCVSVCMSVCMYISDFRENDGSVCVVM